MAKRAKKTKDGRVVRASKADPSAGGLEVAIVKPVLSGMTDYLEIALSSPEVSQVILAKAFRSEVLASTENES